MARISDPGLKDCRQVANNTLGEKPHRGQLPWMGTVTGACGTSSCLARLPTRRGGTESAVWNDFAGLEVPGAAV